MKLLKKYKYLIKFIISLLIITTILTILTLIFNISNQTSNIIIFITMSLFFLLTGINLGKNTENKAYKTGFIKGLTFILIMYIIGGFTLSFSLTLKKLFYYIILLSCIILGSIIGINKKKSK